MVIRPHGLPLDSSRVDTPAGTWLVAVRSAVESQNGDTILANLTLEQRIDDEQFRTRELGMTAFARELYDPNLVDGILIRIREWVEATDGDGFLDLTRPRGER